MTDSKPTKPKSGWLNLAVDYGPVIVFFLTYRYFTPESRDNAVGEVFAVVRATAAFILAAIVALGVSKWKLGRISPMLWLSTLLIVGFGSLTIYFQEGVWIQRKPTAVYILFGIALLIGVLRGKALLKLLLDSAFEGLNDTGWLRLSRNWGWFFLFLAALNEVLRHYFNQANGNFGTWISLKLWLFLPLTFLFTFVQIPMLLRHGMAEAAKDEVLTDPPHE